MSSPARPRFVDWVRRVVSNGQDTAVPDAAQRQPEPAQPARVVPEWGTASGRPTPLRHTLVQGRTSTELARRVLVAQLVVVAVCGAIGVIVLLAARPVGPVLVTVAVVGVVLFTIVSRAIPSTWRVSRRRRQEHLAGYTLTRTTRLDLDQVDPVTGYVIRRAGEPALNPTEQRAAVEELAKGPPR